MSRKYFLLHILLVFLLIGGCSAKKNHAPQQHKGEPPQIADIINFPQNLEVYAAIAGKDRQLLPLFEQEAMNTAFDRVFFGPWQMSRPSIRKQEVTALFRRARGYKNATEIWTQPEWDAMRANAGMDTYPNRNMPAITLRDTNLRELPTNSYRFTEPTANVNENPFDYFQYSLLPVGTPLLIAHTSQDGQWHYVECPLAGGWVNARDIALVDSGFKTLWQTGRYAALIRDNVAIPGTGLNNRDSKSGIGALLPFKSRDADGNLNVLAPVAGNGGYARVAELRLAKEDAAIKPMPLTPGNVAVVGNQMMGQNYGWGGMLGLRDCSAMIRDLFTPFGIWLPRNSVAQAKRGKVIPLTGLTASEKANVIMTEGVPFLSLAGMKGHITLYVGIWKGKPAIFHNVWGVRVIRDGNDDERFVIGKAVVTSITPGSELQNLYRPITFVDRLRTLTTPGPR